MVIRDSIRAGFQSFALSCSSKSSGSSVARSASARVTSSRFPPSSSRKAANASLVSCRAPPLISDISLAVSADVGTRSFEHAPSPQRLIFADRHSHAPAAGVVKQTSHVQAPSTAEAAEHPIVARRANVRIGVMACAPVSVAQLTPTALLFPSSDRARRVSCSPLRQSL